MKPNGIEKIIQEKLNARKMEPSAQAWKKLDKILTQAATEKKQPSAYFWLSIAATFLLFSGVGYVYFQQNEKTKLIPTTNEIVVSKPNLKTKTRKQNLKEISVSTENKLANYSTLQAEKSVAINTAQKENSKLEAYETTLLKEQKVVTAHETKKEGIKQEVKEAIYNYTTPEKLLAEVQGQKKLNTTVTFKSSLRVNPNDLLQAVESELDQSFKEKTITKLKQVKSAFVNRNYN